MEDIEKKVDKMEDAGVLPRDGFAGTLNDRCREVKKEQQIVNTSLEEARPKYAISYCLQYLQERVIEGKLLVIIQFLSVLRVLQREFIKAASLLNCFS